MTEPVDAITAAEQFRAAILRGERATAMRLARAYGDLFRRLGPMIDALDAEIAMMAETQNFSAARIGRLERLRALREQIAEQVGRFGVYAEGEIRQGAQDALAAAMRAAEAEVQAALPGLAPLDNAIMARWQRLDPKAVESLLGFLSDDSPLMAGMRDALGPAVADNVAKKLVEGLALGYNPRKVARIVQRELGMGLDSALRVSRTAQINAYREGIRASWLANPRIVKGWEWHAVKDSRTCMSCIALDGTIHPLSEPMRDHWNGRCVALAVLPTYREMGFNVDEPKRERQTARQWFESLPEAAQRAQMGKGKYAAWKAGQFDLADLTTETSDPVWGRMRVEQTLKNLTTAEMAA